MENFIVRIYRYGRDKPNKLMGIVEKVCEEGKKAFTHIDELWEILNLPRPVLKHGEIGKERSAQIRKKQ